MFTKPYEAYKREKEKKVNNREAFIRRRKDDGKELFTQSLLL